MADVYAKGYWHNAAINYTPPRTMFSVQALSGGTQLWLPNPDQSSGKNLIETLVNSGRNANAVVTAQKIGRDQEKTELAWAFLPKNIWEEMLRFWDRNFFFRFNYYSRISGVRITRKFYIGDRSDQPFAISDDGYTPVAYVNCVANVIDTGEGA